MILNEVIEILRKRMSIYTNLLSDNYNITNITKNIIDANNTDYIITTDTNIRIKTPQNDYRNIEAGDGVCLKNIKYKYKIEKIKKDDSPSFFYKNLTTVTAENKLKFYYADTIEINGITTDTAYNGIHRLYVINRSPAIMHDANKFKINIDPLVNITTNEIDNEGFYQLMFWNANECYGSLNDYFNVTEIIDDNNFKIRITKNSSINKFFIDTDYDELDLTSAIVNANPRIADFGTIEREMDLYKKIMQTQENSNSNNWLFLTSDEQKNSTTGGLAIDDPSVLFDSNTKFRTRRDYVVNVRLMSNNSSFDISDREFNNLAYEIQLAVEVCLCNKHLATNFVENNYYAFATLPLDPSQNQRDREFSKTIVYKDFPFLITTFVNAQDYLNYEANNYEVPLLEFGTKFYKEDEIDYIDIETNNLQD